MSVFTKSYLYNLSEFVEWFNLENGANIRVYNIKLGIIFFLFLPIDIINGLIEEKCLCASC